MSTKDASGATAMSIPAIDLYPAILSVSPAGVLHVTGDGMTAPVDTSLKSFPHTLVLYLKAAPSTAQPSWPKVADLLRGLGNITYQISPGVPATVSLSGSTTLQLDSPSQAKTQEQVLMASGDTLVVTLKGTPSAASPAWPAVAERLANLGSIAFGVDITCVG